MTRRISTCVAVVLWTTLAAVPAGAEPKVLADFRDVRSWHYTAVEAAARVSRLDNGDGELRIEVAPSSAEFKHFAEPHAAIVVTDASGRIIAQQTVTELAMAMGRDVNRKHRAGRVQVETGKFRDAAYAFFMLKFCGWVQGFDRAVHQNNGCFKSSLKREFRQMTDELPGKLANVKVAVGGRFDLMGWQGVRLR